MKQNRIFVVSLVLACSGAAVAEDFSTDVSSLWDVITYQLKETGGSTLDYLGYTVSQSASVSGGDLIVGFPSGGAPTAGNTTDVVSYLTTSNAGYVGSLLGDNRGKKLVATFKFDTSKQDGAAFTDADFFWEKGSPAASPAIRLYFEGPNDLDPKQCWWSQTSVTYVNTMADAVYVTMEADLTDTAAWWSWDGQSSAGFVSDFLYSAEHTSKVGVTFGGYWGYAYGFKLDNGLTGDFKLTNYSAEAVPEPITLALTGAGLGLALLKRRQKA